MNLFEVIVFASAPPPEGGTPYFTHRLEFFHALLDLRFKFAVAEQRCLESRALAGGTIVLSTILRRLHRGLRKNLLTPKTEVVSLRTGESTGQSVSDR